MGGGWDRAGNEMFADRDEQLTTNDTATTTTATAVMDGYPDNAQVDKTVCNTRMEASK